MWTVSAAVKLKDVTTWKKTMTNSRQPIKSRDITFQSKSIQAKAMVFPVVENVQM